MLRIADPTDRPTTFAVRGENFDAAAAPAVEAEVTGLLTGRDVALDLTAVRFADSSGIAVLVRLHAAFGGRVWLANVTPPLARCLSRAPAGCLPPATDAPPDRGAPPDPTDRRVASRLAARGFACEAASG